MIPRDIGRPDGDLQSKKRKLEQRPGEGLQSKKRKLEQPDEGLQSKEKKLGLEPWFYDDSSYLGRSVYLKRSRKAKNRIEGLGDVEEIEEIEEQWENIYRIVLPELQKGLNGIYALHDSKLQKLYEDFLEAHSTTLFLPISGDNVESGRIREATEKDPNLQATQAFMEILDKLEKRRMESDKAVIRKFFSAILKDREKNFAEKLEKLPSMIPSMIEERISQERASLPETAELKDAFGGIRERFDEHQSEIDSLGGAASHSKSENDLEKEGEGLLTPKPAEHDISDLGEEVERLGLHDNLGDLGEEEAEKLKSYESQTHERFLELSRAYEVVRTKAREAYYEGMDRSKNPLKLVAANDEEAEEFLRMFTEAIQESEAKVSSHETINTMKKEQKEFEAAIAAIPTEKTTSSRKREDILLVRMQQIETEKRGHLAAMREINQAVCASKDASEEILAYTDAKDALANLDKDKAVSNDLEQEKATREEGKDFLTPKPAKQDSLSELRENVKKLKSYESQTHKRFLELSRAYEAVRTKAREAYYERMNRSKSTLELAAANDEEAEEFLRMFTGAIQESEAKVSSHETINTMKKEQKEFEAAIAAILNEKTTFPRKREDIRRIRRQQIETEKRGHLAAMREINQAVCASKDALEEILAYVKAKNALANLDKI